MATGDPGGGQPPGSGKDQVGCSGRSGRCPRSSVATLDGTDSTSIENDIVYSWRQWKLMANNEGAFLWSDYCAIELPNRSDGWFPFMFEDRIATMLSSGTPVSGKTTPDFKETISRLQLAYGPGYQALRPILTSAGLTKLRIGRWQLSSVLSGTLSIELEAQSQVTELCEDGHGFVFQPNTGSRCSFTHHKPLPLEASVSKFGKAQEEVKKKKSDSADKAETNMEKQASLPQHLKSVSSSPAKGGIKWLATTKSVNTDSGPPAEPNPSGQKRQTSNVQQTGKPDERRRQKNSDARQHPAAQAGRILTGDGQ
eukprot:scpid92344/ scgid19472/ E3 ubiquitin-protein ligase HECTD1; HECT domain-containing protein 1; Protein open mind